MSEDRTYDQLLRDKLDHIQELARQQGVNIDTRPGSLIWFAVSGNSLESALLYLEILQVLNESFVDTQSRPYLIRRCKERGVPVRPAARAVRQGEFNIDVPIGARFSLNRLNYIVTERKSAGIYRMECETPGNAGNTESGALIPIFSAVVPDIPGLEWARLTDVLIPGEDDEPTERIRQRYFDSLNSQAFGGNVQDYYDRVSNLDGVGGVKVYPVFAGGYTPDDLLPPGGAGAWIGSLSGAPAMLGWINRVYAMITSGVVTVGAGTVRVVITDSQHNAPSVELIDAIQTAIDPEGNHGAGLGIAPIGHFVTVEGAAAETIDVKLSLTFTGGWDWAAAEPYVLAVLDGYYAELASEWDRVDWRADPAATLIVRISRIESRLLNLTGVIDAEVTLINGAAQNYVLDSNAVPVRGAVVHV